MQSENIVSHGMIRLLSYAADTSRVSDPLKQHVAQNQLRWRAPVIG